MDKLSVDRWSPHLSSSNRQLDASPVLGPNSHLPYDREYDGEGNEVRVLGSPFHTPGERDRLSVGPRTGDGEH